MKVFVKILIKTRLRNHRGNDPFPSEYTTASCPHRYTGENTHAQEQHLGPDKHIALVLDQAGWHTSSRLRLPEGLHLLFLPSHSPELQPAERLWSLCNEPLVNRVFASLDELEQVQADRCRWLQAHPDSIRERTSYHWWPPLLDTTSTDLI